MRFRDKVALVTGAGSGIGRATARLLAREGARVGVVDVDGAAAKRVAKEITDDGGTALAVRADVAREADAQRMVDELVGAYGALHVLHNHAGILRPGRVTDLTEQAIDEVLAVNVKGVLFSSKYGVPAIARSGGGAIVNTASDLALIGLGGVALYSASKGAIASLTRAMAVDHAPDKIRVNAVCPGFTYTNMTAGMASDVVLMREMAKEYLTRYGQPEDIAEAVAYLASDAAAYVTGTLLVVDGGHTAH